MRRGQPLVQATLHVTPRGLTTSAIPYASGAFDSDFDFVDHQLPVRTSDGGGRAAALASRPIRRCCGCWPTGWGGRGRPDTFRPPAGLSLLFPRHR